MPEYITREAVLSFAYWDGYGGTRYGVVTTEDIELIPAAEVAPVLHGRWISKTGRAACSVCYNECWADSVLEYKYCPNCGAKMEEEEKK